MSVRPALVPGDERPGRSCPLSYRYAPRSLARAPEITAETLYVAGGLYGNVEALTALEALAASEGATLAFNGDFHWFDTAPADFRRISSAVLDSGPARVAIRGNVETEFAGEERGAGCGCAYPADVSDPDVERSNAILERLRETARGFPALRARHGALAMTLVAAVGEARVAIVHGDAASLAGWGFAHDRLDDPGHRRWIESAFRDSGADIFASSHTCLPAFRTFDFARGRSVVVNNGAAGMPNFADSEFGVVTRIATRPAPFATLYGVRVRQVFVDAVALAFDTPRWIARFLASWPEGSPAHASYFRRIVAGPRYAPALAAPRAA